MSRHEFGGEARHGGSRPPRKKRIWYLAMGYIAVVSLVLTACGGSGSGTGAPANGGSGGGGGLPSTVNLRINGDYPCLDPYGMACGSLVSQEVFNPMYDQLMTFGPSGKLVPYLASAWTVTNAPTTSIVFTIVKGATCSDGSKMDATAVAASLKSYFTRIEAENPNLLSSYGPGPYNVTADEATNQVTFKLPTPNPTVVSRFSRIPIVCSAGLAPGAQTAPQTKFDTKSYGSGPYTMVSATHGENLVLQLRPDWTWGPGGVTDKDLPRKLVLQEVTNETTAANLLLTGGLQVSSVTGPDVQRLVSNKSLSVFKASDYFAYIIPFNENPGHVTTDVNVRKALAMAIDPNTFGSAAFGPGGYTVATDALSTDSQCYQNNSDIIAKPSVAAAKTILTNDGYTMGSDGFFSKGGHQLHVTLDTTTAGIGQGGDYIVSALNNIGVKVTSEGGAYVTFQKDLAQTDGWDLATATYPAQLPTPNYFIIDMIGPKNVDHTVDPAAYTIEQQAQRATGCTEWEQFWRAEIQNYDFIPNVYPIYYWFTTNNIQVVPAPNYIEEQFMRAGS